MDINDLVKNDKETLRTLQRLDKTSTRYIETLKQFERLSSPLRERGKIISSLGLNNRFRNDYQNALKSIQQINKPISEFNKAFSSIYRINSAQQELTRSIGSLKPFNELQGTLTTIKKLAKPLRHFGRTTSSIQLLSEPLRDFQKSYDRLLKGSAAWKHLRSSVVAIKELNEFEKQLQHVKVNFPDPEVSIEVDQSGDVKLSDTKIGLEELQNIVDEIVSEITDNQKPTFDELVDKVSAEIQKQDDPNLRIILRVYIYPLILNLIFFFAIPFFSDISNSDTKTDQKKFAKELKDRVRGISSNVEQLKSIRYVSATNLNVRYSNSRKSKIVGTLHFGNLVIIVNKRRNWTLVEWSDPNSEILIRGWVFTRYLKTFK